MNELPAAHRQAIETELLQFACDQSPLFQKHVVQSMSLQHGCSLHDDWNTLLPSDIRHNDTPTDRISQDITTLELGFDATRTTDAATNQPNYLFTARFIVNQISEPQQLRLPPTDWEELAYYYSDESPDETMPVSPHQVMQDMDGEHVTCERYRRVDYSYSTAEGSLHVNDENGYLVDGDPFYVLETHPQLTIAHQEAADMMPDPVGPRDAIMTRVQFEHTVQSLRQELQATGDIMPPTDKLRELRFLITCLKKRLIPLD